MRRAALLNTLFIHHPIYSFTRNIQRRRGKVPEIFLTDSGGIQEEAPSLGKPVLVLREVAERPEVIEAGTVKVAGLNKNRIIKETQRLLDDETLYEKMSKATNPYGDGKASKRIVEILGKSL